MKTETITSLTTAFNVDQFVTMFVSFAPWLLTIVGAIIGLGLLGFGIRWIMRRFKKPV